MLTGYPVAGKGKSKLLIDAFIAGAPKDAVGAVFYGVDESNVEEWRRVRREQQVPWWYLDNSWFDVCRGTYFRVARNALQIDGRSCTDGKRFKALRLQVAPWRSNGTYILLCPQSTHFMNMIADEPNWLGETLDELHRVSLRPIRIRRWERDKIALASTLEADLAEAHALVTHSSAAAVTALLSGVPIVSASGACWYMGTDVAQVERPLYPPNRETFFGVLADNQFTVGELAAGLAWKAISG